jgi:hypothetical protein
VARRPSRPPRILLVIFRCHPFAVLPLNSGGPRGGVLLAALLALLERRGYVGQQLPFGQANFAAESKNADECTQSPGLPPAAQRYASGNHSSHGQRHFERQCITPQRYPLAASISCSTTMASRSFTDRCCTVSVAVYVLVQQRLWTSLIKQVRLLHRSENCLSNF